MTCERIESQLSQLIDNELDTATSARLSQHLAECPNCRRTYHELKLLVGMSAELETQNPSEQLYAKIWRAARNSQHRPRFAPRQIGWILVPALATVVLMLVVFPRTGAHREATPTAPSTLTVSPAPTEPAQLAAEPATRPTVVTNTRPVGVARPLRRAPQPSSLTPTATGPLTIPAADLIPVAPEPRPAGESPVHASLREIQQALEEIEAALYQNPGNPQVRSAYLATYQKGLELQNRYLLGAQ